jgi:hypothetical protein
MRQAVGRLTVIISQFSKISRQQSHEFMQDTGIQYIYPMSSDTFEAFIP